MSVRSVDAVIVGAGHNGLVAANLLADAGWEVLVCEATAGAGGAVQTAELTVPGFHHDLCSAFYPLGVASPVLQALNLTEYGLQWRHAPAVLAHVFADDRVALLSRDPAETAASVAAFDSADGDAWLREVELWDGIGERVVEALLRPFPPVRAGAGLLRSLGTASALRLARMAVQPVRDYGHERYRGDGARLLLAGNALHSDLGPEQAGSTLFGWLLAMLGQSVGFPVPVGGAGRLTAALVRRLESRGGTIEYGRGIRRVLHARGRAMGVEDVHGEHVRARRAVLADVPAPTLYHDLVGPSALPPAFARDLDRFRWDPATIKIDWALSGPVPWTAAQAREAGTVHLDSDLDALSEYGLDLVRERVPKHPFLLLGQMTTSDPSRSPAGTEAVWAYSHVPRSHAGDEALLREHAERMEEVIERHAPGFRSSVLGRNVQLPGDLQAHNPSLVGGAINGGTAAIHQQLVFRPVPGLGRADTPLDRLYLASSSAHPGGGVHGACGANAARAALARNGALGSAYRSVIDLMHRQIY